MIDNISYEELISLKDGVPPWGINENWDCAMVIEYLAENLYYYVSIENTEDYISSFTDNELYDMTRKIQDYFYKN